MSSVTLDLHAGESNRTGSQWQHGSLKQLETKTVQHHGLGEGCLLAADGVTVHKEMLYERVMQKKPEVCYSTTGKPAAIWNKLL